MRTLRLNRIALGIVSCALALVFAAHAFQNVHPVTGRAIAPVMGAAGADWLDRPEREKEENPEGALDAIGIRPGMIVADIGAGTGIWTRMLCDCGLAVCAVEPNLAMRAEGKKMTSQACCLTRLQKSVSSKKKKNLSSKPLRASKTLRFITRAAPISESTGSG